MHTKKARLRREKKKCQSAKSKGEWEKRQKKNRGSLFMCAIEPRHDRGEGYKKGGNIPYVGIYKNQLASL